MVSVMDIVTKWSFESFRQVICLRTSRMRKHSLVNSLPRLSPGVKSIASFSTLFNTLRAR